MDKRNSFFILQFMHTCTHYSYWKLCFFSALQLKTHQRLLRLSVWHFRPSVKRKWFMQISCSANAAQHDFPPVIIWPLQQSNYWNTLSPKITDLQSQFELRDTAHVLGTHCQAFVWWCVCVYVCGFVRLTCWKWPPVILQCQTSSVFQRLAHTCTHTWLHCQLCYSDILTLYQLQANTARGGKMRVLFLDECMTLLHSI